MHVAQHVRTLADPYTILTASAGAHVGCMLQGNRQDCMQNVKQHMPGWLVHTTASSSTHADHVSFCLYKLYQESFLGRSNEQSKQHDHLGIACTCSPMIHASHACILTDMQRAPDAKRCNQNPALHRFPLLQIVAFLALSLDGQALCIMSQAYCHCHKKACL